ncbi:MAG TPA: 4Fe-4S double cluster binding domain-containing protein, partial [Chitinophagales bacterium]|nr:4Fe-4S double cluster binding domain-containing protein [Chitinophagales bacterium]
KNTNIIHPKSGSFFFLAEIISDLDLIPDGPIKDHCGTCTACIDACPTEALTPYHIDATKCISYLTIELRDAIPLSFAGKMNNWMYGCDICQDVCPWNRFSKHHQQERFLPSDDLQQMQKSDWQEITEDIYRKLFKGSAVKRAKFVGLKRNIAFLNGE